MIDIDSKVPSLGDLLKYFSDYVESVDDIQVSETTNGWHVKLGSMPDDFREHVALIEIVKKDNPTWGVDDKAGLHSIKVIGTKSKKTGSVNKRLIHPSWVNNNDTLSCLVNIQPRYEIIDGESDRIIGVTPEDFIGNDSISEEEIEKISVLLTGQHGQISGIVNHSRNMITLARKPGCYCNICHRRHGVSLYGIVEYKCTDAFVRIYSDKLVVGCFRNTKNKLIIDRNVVGENVSHFSD
jgi:hypothetical protein